MLCQAHTVIVEQDHRNADSCRKALIVCQGGNEYSQSDQGCAQNKKGKDRAVGGQKIYVSIAGKYQRIYGNNRQGDQIYNKKRQIFSQYNLCGGNGKGV